MNDIRVSTKKVLVFGLMVVGILAMMMRMQPPGPAAAEADVVTCNEHIKNGGFETGTFQNWVKAGSPWMANYLSYDGSYSAVLGGADDHDDMIYQAVTLPANPATVTFSYHWYIYSEEVSDVAYDEMYVDVYDTQGRILATLEELSNKSTKNSWQSSSFNLKDYPSLMGKTVYLAFNGTTDASMFTSFYIDAVSLEICTGPVQDVALSEMEVTQVIQNLANDVDLIAGKPTWVRLYPTAGAKDWQVTGYLEGSLNGSALYPSTIMCGSIKAPAAPSLYKQRANWQQTINCPVPASWVGQGGKLKLTAHLIADGALDPKPENNQKVVSIDVKPAPQMHMQIVQVRDGGFLGWGSKGPEYADYKDIHKTAQDFYPLSKITLHPHKRTVPWLTGPLTLAAIAAVDLLDRDPGPNTVIMGVVRREVWSPAAIGMGLPTGHAWTKMLPWAYRDTAAHESGHAFDLGHVDACGAFWPPVESNYPYPKKWISAGGTRDHWGLDTSQSPPKIRDPKSHPDFMTYCYPYWISPFHYNKLYNQMKPGATLVQNMPLEQPQEALYRTVHPQADTEYLMVVGYLNADEASMTLLPPMRLMGSDLDPDSQITIDGDYHLMLMDASEYVLSGLAFGIPEGAHADESAPFSLLIPYEANTARVVIMHGDSELVSIPVSANPPNIKIAEIANTTITSDELVISWTATDTDGDDLTTMVYFSADGGASWELVSFGIEGDKVEVDTSLWQGTTQGMLRVLVTDGIHAADDITGPFTVPSKAPWVSIIDPEVGTGLTPDGPIQFTATGYDAEDGPLDGTTFNWESDRDGPLGLGEHVGVTGLSVGLHQITVTVTDSDLNTSSDVLNIYVGYQIMLPVLSR